MDEPFAYFDVLGFKEFAQSTTLDVLRKFYVEILHEINHCTGFHKDLYPQFSIISDSICIWPRYKAGENKQLASHAFFHFLSIVLHNFIFNLYIRNTAIRGGISFGEYLASYHTNLLGTENLTSIIIGKPIIDAFKWESSQKWLGASLVPEHIELMKNKLPLLLGNLVDNNYLIEYDVPTSEGIRKSLAVNFVTESHAEYLSEAILRKEKSCKESNHLAKYYATRLFVDFVAKNNKFVSLKKFTPFENSRTI